MKLSNETQTILKNFANINKGILIQPGNKLWSRTSAVFGEAIVAETFPLEVGIFEINNFLSVLGLFTDPDLEFGEDYLRISEPDGKMETRYHYAAASLVSQKYPKTIKDVPANGINFTITEEQWVKLQKANSVFQKPEVKITSTGKVVRISSSDHKNERGNSFSMTLDGDPQGNKCSMVFLKEHMNLLKGSYSGVLTESFTIFRNTSGLDLYYYIGSDPSSTFGENEDDE